MPIFIGMTFRIMKINNIPTHVAIIYDGNRRWAEQHGLPEKEGHKAGAQNVVDNILKYGREFGVKYLTLWLFSTENWKRDEMEVGFIWDLFRKYFKEFSQRFINEQIRFHHVGRRDRLPEDVIDFIERLERDTKDFDDYHLCLALDYGGRDEIVRATRRIIEAGLKPEDVTEDTFIQYLDSKDIPEPDLIIRTSGELRLSGFMAWEGTYSELYFSEKHGPDFDREEFEKALISYSKRNRRFGGNNKNSKIKSQKSK